MILLVVGVAAVIVVIFIAVFLSIRLGRGDDHDEPEARADTRERGRAGEDHRLDEHERDEDPRTRTGHPRVAAGHPRPRDGGQPRMREERRTSAARRAEGGDPRRPGQQPAVTYADRRAREHDRRRAPHAPGYQGDYGNDADYGERDGRRPGYDDLEARRPAYDTGSRAAVTAGVPGAPAERMSAEQRVRRDARPPRRNADRPSGGYPAAQATSRPEPTAAKARARQRARADDEWQSTEWDKLSDEQYWAELSADKPLAGMARRKPASGTGAAPDNGAKGTAPGPGKPASPSPAAAGSRPPRRPDRRHLHDNGPTPASRALPDRALPDRALPDRALPDRALPDRDLARHGSSAPVPHASSGQAIQAAPTPADLPADVYGAPVPTGRANSASGDYAPRRQASLGSGRSLPGRTEVPGRSDVGPPPAELPHRLPAGSRELAAHAAHSVPDTVRPARDTAGAHRSMPGGVRAASEHGLDALNGLARSPGSPPSAALDDDPLTSPSFAAITSTDSRSYGVARRHAAPAHASPPATGRENGYRGQHDDGRLGADQLTTSYLDQAPVPAPLAGNRHNVPGQQQAIPAYGNPYGDPVRSAAGATQPVPANGHAAVDYTGYAGGQPAGYPQHASAGYPQPAYVAPPSGQYPGAPAVPFPEQHLGLPPQRLSDPDDGTRLGGYPGQQPYGDSSLAAPPSPGGYASTGHAPRYDGGRASDPYWAGGYDGYPAQG